MKKIAILGNSSAVVQLVDKLRGQDQELSITLFPLSEHLPYHRHLLVDFFKEYNTLDQLYCQPWKYYERNKVAIVQDKKIKRISLKRKYISLEDKSQIEFDALVVAGTEGVKFSEFNGNAKNGVLRAGRLEDVISVINLLPVAETFIIQDQSLQALEMAFALSQKNKEVLWVNPGNQLLPELLDARTALFINNLMQNSGIRSIEKNKIAEILGDDDLKAVKMQSGKVFGCHALFLGGEAPDLRLFKDSDLMMKNGICVNHLFQSNLKEVYAMGDVCAFRLLSSLRNTPIYSEAIDKQGAIVGAALREEEPIYDIALNVNTFALAEASVTIMGRTLKGENVEEYQSIDEENQIFKKIFVQDNCIIGAVLINAPEQKDEIYHLIVQQEEVSDKIALIVGAQDNEPKSSKDSAAETENQPQMCETSVMDSENVRVAEENS